MARVRKIERNPVSSRNYFLVDACFLANKYIPLNRVPTLPDIGRIQKCLEWWKEIDLQLRTKKARIYIPDVCIAETFKTLAKKYYSDHWFHNAGEFNNARNRLRNDIVTSPKTLKAFDRKIRYHDISTSRDIIIAVDRFYELFMKKKLNVSLPDLIIVATAKYLIDFYDIPKSLIHIITLDNALWKGSKQIQELPNAYDPTAASDTYNIVFQ